MTDPKLIQPEIERIVGEQAPGTLSLGLAAAVWGATSGANAIIRAMNRAYGVPESRPIWRRYLLAFGLTVLSAVESESLSRRRVAVPRSRIVIGSSATARPLPTVGRRM